MQMIVNGKPVALEGEIALPAFLELRGIDAHHIAVAVNGEVVERTEYASITLGAGDVVEIVRMVGGG
jgi:sulfur carrier protein